MIAIKSKKRVLAVNISLAALCERQGGRTPISNLNFYFQETKHLDMKILLCGYWMVTKIRGRLRSKLKHLWICVGAILFAYDLIIWKEMQWISAKCRRRSSRIPNFFPIQIVPHSRPPEWWWMRSRFLWMKNVTIVCVIGVKVQATGIGTWLQGNATLLIFHFHSLVW